MAIVLVLILGTTAFASGIPNTPDEFDAAEQGLAAVSDYVQDFFGGKAPNDIELCKPDSVDMGDWNGLDLTYFKKCGWTLRTVSLVRAYLLKTTEKWLSNDVGNSNFLAAYVSVIFLLAMTLHGVKLTAGALRNPLADTFILIIKMAIASYFVFNMDKYGHIPFALLDFLISLPTKVLDVLLDGDKLLETKVWGNAGLKCIYIPEDGGYASLWMRADCLMSRLLGITFDGYTISGGILLLLLVFFTSGILAPIAAYIFISFISIIFFCVGAYLKAVATYIKALLNIMALVCISVLFIPFAVLPQAVMGGVKGGALGNLITQMIDSTVIPFLMYTYMSFFIVIVALSYQDLYNSFVITKGNATVMETVAGSTHTKTALTVGTCKPFGKGDSSTATGLAKKAGNFTVGLLDDAVSGVNTITNLFLDGGIDVSFKYACLAEDLVNTFKNIALAATVLLFATYLMYIYQRYFISLTTLFAGQFDTDLMSSSGVGKYFKKGVNAAKATVTSGVKAASGNVAGAAADVAKETAKNAKETADDVSGGGNDG